MFFADDAFEKEDMYTGSPERLRVLSVPCAVIACVVSYEVCAVAKRAQIEARLQMEDTSVTVAPHVPCRLETFKVLLVVEN